MSSEWIGYYDFTKDDVLSQINDVPGRMNRTAYLNIRVLQSRKAKSRHNTRRSQMVGRIRRLLNNMVEEGLLTREEDNQDGLGFGWALTDLGKVVKSSLPSPTASINNPKG